MKVVDGPHTVICVYACMHMCVYMHVCFVKVTHVHNVHSG